MGVSSSGESLVSWLMSPSNFLGMMMLGMVSSVFGRGISAMAIWCPFVPTALSIFWSVMGSRKVPLRYCLVSSSETAKEVVSIRNWKSFALRVKDMVGWS